MPRISLDLTNNEYATFRSLVGERKMALTLRGYVKAYTSTGDLNEAVIRKRLEILKVEKDRIDAEYFDLQTKIEGIDTKRKAEELSRLEVEKAEAAQISQIKHDLMKSQLTGKVMGK